MFFLPFTVNNTLTEAEKDKEKETDTYSNRDISKTKEKEGANTPQEKESGAGEDINTGRENTTAVSGEDKYTGTIPGKTASEGGNEGEPDERNTGPEKPSGGGEDKVASKGPDNSLDTFEMKEPKQPDKKEDSSDTNFDKGEADEKIKEKGQEESERKEKQVNGKRDPDKVGPNDTKLRTAISAGENTVERFEVEITKNDTVTHDRENNTIESLLPGRKIIPSRFNITLYRAESGKAKETKKDEKEKDSSEKTKEEVEHERKEKEEEKEREINQSFTGKRI